MGIARAVREIGTGLGTGDAMAGFRARLLVCTLALAVNAVTSRPTLAQGFDTATPIMSRHLETSRVEANKSPRNEADQAVIDGWPLYRTPRGQAAFNAAMATLRATEGAPPALAAFKGCKALDCPISLPSIGADGWLPAGRIWVSPVQYVLIAHSPRLAEGKSYRRRTYRKMEYFVFHEFNNTARNADPYDTISSHKDEVFVPLYMSKERMDARGRKFVTIVQVAPYDVVSIHATNMDSNGPGMEVAKNAGDEMEPLQGLAGIVVASMIKAAAPHLQVVNHHGNEGLPMLQGYEGRLERIKSRPASANVSLPFVPAASDKVATASGRLADLVRGNGPPPPIAVAQRGLVGSAARVSASEPVLVAPPVLARRPSQHGMGG